jgi:hypothetical protein
MTRTCRTRRIWQLGVAVAAVAAGLTAAAVPAVARSHATSYIFKKLNNNGDPTFNQLFGINNRGRIVGYFGSGVHGHPNRGYQIAPPYSQARYKAENFPRSAQTEVTGLNDAGVTVGLYSMTNKANAFLNAFAGFYLKNGKYHKVVFPTSDNSSPRFDELLGLNNAGMAVGDYRDSLGSLHGFRYNIFTHKFARIHVGGAANVTVTAINGGGSVVGFFANASGKVISFMRHSSGQVATFSKARADLTEALGVSKSGEVVGAYTIGNRTFGYTWQAGRGFRTVNDPGGVGSTIINGVNNSGELVGFYTDAHGNTDGMLAIP